MRRDPQLKRFDFDYSTGSRVKLNAEVGRAQGCAPTPCKALGIGLTMHAAAAAVCQVDFPLVLDMNPMMNTNFAQAAAADTTEAEGDTLAEVETEPEAASGSASADVSSGAGAGGGGDEAGTAGEAAAPAPAAPEDAAAAASAADEGDVEAGIAPAAATAFDTPVATMEEMLARGPEVFELFSVMVHRGGTSSGHYFAYIKNLDDGRWCQFNDSSVTPATLKQVKSARGDGRSSSNAYMLMYRCARLASATDAAQCVTCCVMVWRCVARNAGGWKRAVESICQPTRTCLLLWRRWSLSKTRRRHGSRSRRGWRP